MVLNKSHLELDLVNKPEILLQGTLFLQCILVLTLQTVNLVYNWISTTSFYDDILYHKQIQDKQGKLFEFIILLRIFCSVNTIRIKYIMYKLLSWYDESNHE